MGRHKSFEEENQLFRALNLNRYNDISLKPHQISEEMNVILLGRVFLRRFKSGFMIPKCSESVLKYSDPQITKLCSEHFVITQPRASSLI